LFLVLWMMFSLLSFQDGESGSLDFEDFPSSPKSPLSPKRPWQASENNRNCMYYNCAIYSFVILFSVLTPLLSFSYWLCLFLCSQPRGQGWIVLHWSNLENSNRTFEGVSMSGLGHTLFWCYCEARFSAESSYRFITKKLLLVLFDFEFTNFLMFLVNVPEVKSEHLSEVRAKSSAVSVRCIFYS
jgi:hypothetical protein